MSRGSPKDAAAAVGFSVHTGWALAIVVSGSPDAPRPLLRRRLTLTEARGHGFVFHRAAEALAAGRALSHAERMVQSARRDVSRRAKAELRKVWAELPSGTKLATAGMVLSNAAPPSDLARILHAHPLVHAAEGALFREAVAAACRARRVPVLGVPARELTARAAAALRVPVGRLPGRLREAGLALGRPWGRDEKDAFLVAWLALAGAPHAA